MNCQQARKIIDSGHIGLCFAGHIGSQIPSNNYGRGATKIDRLPEELIFSNHKIIVCLKNSRLINATLPSFHTTGIQLS